MKYLHPLVLKIENEVERKKKENNICILKTVEIYIWNSTKRLAAFQGCK